MIRIKAASSISLYDFYDIDKFFGLSLQLTIIPPEITIDNCRKNIMNGWTQMVCSCQVKYSTFCIEN